MNLLNRELVGVQPVQSVGNRLLRVASLADHESSVPPVLTYVNTRSVVRCGMRDARYVSATAANFHGFTGPQVTAIMRQPTTDGLNFSARIWDNRQRLVQELNRLIPRRC